MVIFFLSLLSASFAIECPRPQTPDGGYLENQDHTNHFVSFYPKDAVVFQRCNGRDISESGQTRTCGMTGKWKVKPIQCGKDIAASLLWKESNCSFTQSLTGGCFSSSSWEADLLGDFDVEALFLGFHSQEGTYTLNVELFSKTGASKKCTYRGQSSVITPSGNSLSIQSCSQRAVNRVKITSPVTMDMYRIAVYSQIGSPKFNNSAPYTTSENTVQRVVTGFDSVRYDVAKKNCNDFGGKLLEVRRPESLAILEHAKFRELWIGLSYSNGAWRWESGAAFDQAAFSGFPLPKNPKNGMAAAFKFIDQENGMYKPALVLQSKTKQLQFACQLDSIPMTCQSPGTPEAGRILRSSDEQTTYTCFEGYQLIGSPVRKCDLATGKYMSEMPKCVKK